LDRFLNNGIFLIVLTLVFDRQALIQALLRLLEWSESRKGAIRSLNYPNDDIEVMGLAAGHFDGVANRITGWESHGSQQASEDTQSRHKSGHPKAHASNFPWTYHLDPHGPCGRALRQVCSELLKR
jgi:hypothetical protein